MDLKIGDKIQFKESNRCWTGLRKVTAWIMWKDKSGFWLVRDDDRNFYLLPIEDIIREEKQCHK